MLILESSNNFSHAERAFSLHAIEHSKYFTDINTGINYFSDSCHQTYYKQLKGRKLIHCTEMESIMAKETMKAREAHAGAMRASFTSGWIRNAPCDFSSTHETLANGTLANTSGSAIFR